MRNDMIWFKRKFEFTQELELYPMVLDRLRGAPARLEEKLKGVPEAVLKAKEGDSWSIQEQVGHLTMVELLWDARTTDFLDGKSELTAADIKNLPTKKIDFQSADIQELVRTFRERRTRLVKRLEQFSIEQAGQSAHHPRLDKPMRVIDHAFFAAEHDDHHLAKMSGMIEG